MSGDLNQEIEDLRKSIIIALKYIYDQGRDVDWDLDQWMRLRKDITSKACEICNDITSKYDVTKRSLINQSNINYAKMQGGIFLKNMSGNASTGRKRAKEYMEKLDQEMTARGYRWRSKKKTKAKK